MTLTVGAVLLGGALLIVLALFLARPFFDPTYRDEMAAPPLTQRDALLAQKEGLLDAIRQLEFEHEIGKVPTAVYDVQRQDLVLKTADVMRQIDEGGATADAETVADIEATIKQMRRARPKTKALIFCTECGQPLDVNDKFCAACGQKIQALPVAS